LDHQRIFTSRDVAERKTPIRIYRRNGMERLARNRLCPEILEDYKKDDLSTYGLDLHLMTIPVEKGSIGGSIFNITCDIGVSFNK
jgi:hypothetical protein